MQSKVNYSQKQIQRDEGGRGHIVEELMAIKNEYRIYGKKILELGCGGGANLLCFSNDNEVYGVDGLESAVAIAQSKGIQIIRANLDNDFDLTVKDCDWILLIDVLEHLMYPERLLRRVKDILSPNGYLIINVPNHFNLSGRLKILFGKDLDVGNFFPDYNEWENPHIRFFTYDGIKKLASISGFKVVDDRTSHFPAIPLISKVLPKSVSSRVAATLPALFSSGYFLILKNND